ncbi:TPA: peroxiredoxin, partial [archaeon]|nr:peroxiredoxin [Candidatus Naiadarchaeum limnaeum]
METKKAQKLEIGNKAPDFTLFDTNGKKISLKDFRGKKVALYFYPKDDTPGCTAEACSVRDNFDKLKKVGIVVLGVSTDNEKSHQKFVQKYNLPHILLCDTEKEVVEKYGVWGLKN